MFSEREVWRGDRAKPFYETEVRAADQSVDSFVAIPPRSPHFASEVGLSQHTV
jgi:hypothetical protein